MSAIDVNECGPASPWTRRSRPNFYSRWIYDRNAAIRALRERRPFSDHDLSVVDCWSREQAPWGLRLGLCSERPGDPPFAVEVFGPDDGPPYAIIVSYHDGLDLFDYAGDSHFLSSIESALSLVIEQL